jgi:hypothetical protein
VQHSGHHSFSVRVHWRHDPPPAALGHHRCRPLRNGYRSTACPRRHQRRGASGTRSIQPADGCPGAAHRPGSVPQTRAGAPTHRATRAPPHFHLGVDGASAGRPTDSGRPGQRPSAVARAVVSSSASTIGQLPPAGVRSTIAALLLAALAAGAQSYVRIAQVAAVGGAGGTRTSRTPSSRSRNRSSSPGHRSRRTGGLG